MRYKRFIASLIFGLLMSNVLLVLTAEAQVAIRSYYRKDGTYVQPHYRSRPDGNPYNSYSFVGNTNPCTGKTATENPNAHSRNYYRSDPSSPPRSNLCLVSAAVV